MPVDPEVLAEAKAAIGLKSPVRRSEITRKDFRRFSIATGDKNPLWRDDEYAKEAGYEGIVAPALFYTSFNLPDDDLDQLDHTGLGNNMGPRFEVPVRGFPGAVTGGRELEYGVPMCPGDTIFSVETVVDVYEKEGRAGPMIFVISDTLYTNQREEVVLRERQTTIRMKE